MNLTAIGKENIEVEEDTESSDSVMHQEERDMNHLESKSEFPHQSYPLRRRKPKESPDHIIYQTLMGGAEEKPRPELKHYQEVMGKLWDSAMKEAIDFKAKNKVWELEDQPLGKSVIENKWVFRLERGWIKKTVCYKVRLVSKVFIQCYGLDFYEAFSLVFSSSNCRVLTALAAEHGISEGPLIIVEFTVKNKRNRKAL